MIRREFLRGTAGLAVLHPLMAAARGKSVATTCGPNADAAQPEESPLQPELPIIDCHHHLWDHRPYVPGYALQRFLLSDIVGLIAQSGHNVTRTVFCECHSMYRADGPKEMRALGETEFVNGVAAMSASGNYGPCRVASGIVAAADLSLGEAVKPVLEAQIATARDRIRSIRMLTAHASVPLFGKLVTAPDGLLLHPSVRRGAALLEPLGLTWDIWCFYTQLGEVAEVAGALPHTTIILNHLGTPISCGPRAASEREIFPVWKAGMLRLARRENVMVKIGGLGQSLTHTLGSVHRNEPSTSLAPKWRPYIETCIEAFGPDRCMFESNFPPDNAACSYGALWNTFKRITAGYSATEKAHLFSETARRIYRL